MSARDIAEALTAAGHKVQRSHVALQQPIKTLGLHKIAVHLHPEVEAKVTVNVARSPEQAERQAKGEDLTVREETSMDDLGLEVGRALAEAGPTAEQRLGARVRRIQRQGAERCSDSSLVRLNVARDERGTRRSRKHDPCTCCILAGRSTQSVKWRRLGESGKACGSRQRPACAP